MFGLRDLSFSWVFGRAASPDNLLTAALLFGALVTIGKLWPQRSKVLGPLFKNETSNATDRVYRGVTSFLIGLVMGFFVMQISMHYGVMSR